MRVTSIKHEVLRDTCTLTYTRSRIQFSELTSVSKSHTFLISFSHSCLSLCSYIQVVFRLTCNVTDEKSQRLTENLLRLFKFVYFQNWFDTVNVSLPSVSFEHDASWQQKRVAVVKVVPFR